MTAPRKRRSAKVSKVKQPLTDLPVRDASAEEVLGGTVAAMPDAAEMLALQEAMQMENATFSSISNVLRTRHDTVKNSISNIR